MIRKIKTIRNLGVFAQYNTDTSLPDFERYNLFYGWNGCGKTTLSKLFQCLPEGRSDEFLTLEYRVETDSGTFTQGTNFERKIRVFNQEYIEKNVELIGAKAKPIFILGEKNKAIAEQIKKDEELLAVKKREKSECVSIKRAKETEKGKEFSNVAKVIGASTAGSSLRTYRKNNAEAAFEKLGSKQLLDKEQVELNIASLRQDQKEELAPIQIPEITKSGDSIPIDDELLACVEGAKSLCLRTISSTRIERLQNNKEISEWVETGLALHRQHNLEHCEYCEQIIPDERTAELNQHFNEADQKLKTEIEKLTLELKDIKSAITSLKLLDKANLYTDLQSEYQNLYDQFESSRVEVLASIDATLAILNTKKTETARELECEVDVPIQSFKNGIETINSLIETHNSKSKNFQALKNKAIDELEKHHLSEIYDRIEEIDTSIKSESEKIDVLTNGDSRTQEELGILDLEKRIASNKSKIVSEHKACELINEKLTTFLGRNDISFEVSPDGGYTIKRHGKIAKSLSEGEKTAIAFVYFVVNLQDQDFDINNGIVVVDDPVSSLDSNSLFQAFAFLKNSVKDAHQVFLFTHNFDFLKLLLNWLKNVRNSVGRKNFLMIVNRFENSVRTAKIQELDKTLKEHESEYHYLFKKLFEFETDGSIDSVYHVPNIARKVLETFLMFRVPNGEGMFKKMEELTFDEDKKTAIYKFTNDQSHLTGGGFDPSLISETQNNVRYLLEMMEEVFPEHFQILKASVSQS